MERADHEGIATFFAADEPLQAGAVLTLGEQVARHVRALRCGPGHGVWLVDGLGHRASATIVRLSRDAVAAQVHAVEDVPPAPAVHLLVPVADKERMLWLAEKAAELGATSWRPVLWRRSRSVVPRGEGPSFARKVRARMAGALEQSGGAHLPMLFPEAPPERALAAVAESTRLVLDPSGPPVLTRTIGAAATIAVGPEGGLEVAELAQLEACGFQRVSLGSSILRFETAAVAALAVVRAVLAAPTSRRPSSGGTDGD